ncbi:MAG: hypothetical protein AAF957_28315, partial [Planctomycetota bacterium]
MSHVSHVATATIKELFERVASDLSMLSDKTIEVCDIAYEEREDRPVGEGEVHISYRFGVEDVDSQLHHGAMLIPLKPSIALAAYLMMAPDKTVQELVEKGEVDGPVKEAMLEVGTFVAGAGDAALRAVGATCARVVFEGCQGVRADVRPKLDYQEGAPLSVGRASVSVAG